MFNAIQCGFYNFIRGMVSSTYGARCLILGLPSISILDPFRPCRSIQIFPKFLFMWKIINEHLRSWDWLIPAVYPIDHPQASIQTVKFSTRFRFNTDKFLNIVQTHFENNTCITLLVIQWSFRLVHVTRLMVIIGTQNLIPKFFVCPSSITSRVLSWFWYSNTV